MEIEILPVKKYELRFEGNVIGIFKEESSWEGMTKFRSEKGDVIIVKNKGQDFGDVFLRMLDVDVKHKTADVVCVSQSLGLFFDGAESD